MTAFDTGRRAEAAAADFLTSKGCRVVEHNWRTRWCEIDIVATRGGVAYFCEVKYRGTNRQGSGLEYITPKKLEQMRFAAEFWVHMHNWRGEYQLCAVEVSGQQFAVTAAVTDL
jgi:Holliday junction resolvase-like predicted endonuclease